MAKRLLIILVCLCGANLLLQAQSFDKLWRNFEAALLKEHLQTAQAVLKQIEQKAKAEHEEGQWLASLSKQFGVQAEISADSARAVLSLIDQMAESKVQPAEQALWLSVAGMLRLTNVTDTASVSLGKQQLLRSLRNIDALGQTKTEKYSPLFIEGKDSRLYNNDLLSVIGKYVLENTHFSIAECNRVAAKMIDYYRSRGDRAATLLTRLDSVSLSIYPDRKVLEQLAEEYRDLPVNVETYILLTHATMGEGENFSQTATDSLRLSYAKKGLQLYGKEKRANELRNFIRRTEQPYLRMVVDNSVIYPGETVKTVLMGKNVRKVQLRFYRLDLTAADERLTNFERKNFKSMLKKPLQKLDYVFTAAPAYKAQTDTLAFNLGDPGVYCAELIADGKRMDEKLLYVSRVFPLMLSATDGQTRIRLLDAKTGKMLREGFVTEYEETATGRRQIKVIKPDETGEILLSTPLRYNNAKTYFATVGADSYLPDFSVAFMRRGMPHGQKTETHLNLFTDRAIYRPGQMLHYSGVAYTQNGDEINVAKNYEVKLKLYDSNNQTVEETLLRTDEMGVFSGEFKLPSVCLPGYFRLVASRGLGSVDFKVEEYKRPTFTVETDEIVEPYQMGDTIQLCGTVKTYTGLPLVGSRVKYDVARSSLYRAAPTGSLQPQTGETVTDSLGRFCFPVILGGKTDPKNSFNYLRFNVSISVTAENGETVSISTSIPRANRSAWLITHWATSFCKERLDAVSVAKINVAGRSLGGTIDYTIYNKKKQPMAQGSVKSGETFVPNVLRDLASGYYEIVFQAEHTDTLRQTFLLFSETDTKPTGTDVLWQYVRQSESGDSALVMVGSSCQDVTLFYNLFAADKRLESRTITFSDSLLRFPLVYRPEMGDGAWASFVFVKGGNVYSVETTVVKPQPDKRLVLKWSSFRSRLVPGQKETWRLRITRPDGTPVEASLMARLYDASLDALAEHNWHFDINFNRNIGFVYYRTPPARALWLSGDFPIKALKTPSRSFTQWREMLPSAPGGGLKYDFLTYSGATPMKLKKATNRTMSLKRPVVETQSADTFSAVEEETAAEYGATAITPRTNFSETAFFQPTLRTDKEGQVTLSFTLPESLTSWNFTALAHSQAMDYGRLDTTVVARKEFMVQVAMPRFVRQGDKVAIPVSLRNISDKRVEGTLKFVLAHPETNKVIRSFSRKFSLPAKGSDVQSFEFVADCSVAALVCRATAATGSFSDGEEHYLPVLSNRVSVSRSVPFSMAEAGTLDVCLDTLWADMQLAADRRLTIELSSNPTWYALSALPSLATRSGESAVGWALRYYATVLAGRIATLNPEISTLLKEGETDGWVNVLQRNPELKQTLLAETPWVAEAQTEAQRTAALRQLLDKQAVAANKYTALDHLNELQQADGSWSWYKGMAGNAYITSEVALLLSRLQALCGDEDASASLTKAMKYLSAKMAADVKAMKENPEGGGVGETHLRWLYIRALQDLSPDATAKYLTDRAVQASRGFTMYGKALLAVVLGKAGRSQEAADVLKSLKEYTVCSPVMGRYFDTDKAVLSWSSYRIPTQTAVVEALLSMPTSDNVATADEMRLWLMQAKRTQMWESGRATADAVFALLQPSDAHKSVMSLKSSAAPLLYTLKRDNKVLAVNAPSEVDGGESVGYFCQTYGDEKVLSSTNLTVRKQDEGLAWGCAVAQYTLPASAVKSSGNGIALARRFEKKVGGVWLSVKDEEAISTGDVVRQVFVIKADRDFDFVALKSARPANLTPRRPLSGYTWSDGLGAYRAVRDASTDYFIEKLPKGNYTLTEEYVCDRRGRYQCGTSTISSLYAPEFGAQTAGFVVGGE